MCYDLCNKAVSIGIAPNRYLAKIASGLHKPDGLDCITSDTVQDVLRGLQLEDLCGIKEGLSGRLRAAGIHTSLAMYQSAPETLARALRSVVGYAWWQRLHGFEDGSRYTALESQEGGLKQKSFGQSYALGRAYTPADPGLYQILAQLVVKMGRRLRKDDFRAGGVSVSCVFVDHTSWQHQEKTPTMLSADGDFYHAAARLLCQSPKKPVRILAVSCFDLHSQEYQQSLLAEDQRKEDLTRALDRICDRWGDFTVFPGRMLGTNEKVLDRIAFGGVSRNRPS